MPQRFSSRFILLAATLQQLALAGPTPQAAVVVQLWENWSTWSTCSRHCGGGVSKRTRMCLIDESDGWEGSLTPTLCPGDDRQYRSCNTQTCSEEESVSDFRDLQCSLFNSMSHNGRYYDWLPYTKNDNGTINSCALNCYPDGEDFFVTLTEEVVDGTSCSDDIGHPAVCADGTCLTTGCDGLIGSTLKYDECGVCGGNGSTCFLVTDQFERSVQNRNYYTIAIIPAGARTIHIQQLRPTKSYLAVFDVAANKTVLNGNWTVNLPGLYHIAGTVFKYIRQSVLMRQHTQDSLYAPGPITNQLIILMMVSGKGQHSHQFNYSYTRPNEDKGSSVTMPPNYEHQFLNTKYPGQPNQEQEKSRKNNVPPEGGVIKNNSNQISKKPKWAEGPFSSCSQSCGTGFKVAQYQCKQGNQILNDSLCTKAKPDDKLKNCRTFDCQPNWKIGMWTSCSQTCGGGMRTRTVECWRKPADGPLQQTPEKFCPSVKPAAKELCNKEICWKGWWNAHKWQKCNNTCGNGYQRRHVHCLSLTTNDPIPETYCNPRTQPSKRQPCYSRQSCYSLWFTGPWQPCHAKCGMGVQNRTTFCYGTLTGDLDDRTELPDMFCDPDKRAGIQTTRTCKPKPYVPCPPDWVPGNWTECSKTCVTTKQYRNKTNCMENGKSTFGLCDTDTEAYQSRSVTCMYDGKRAPGQCDIIPKPYEYKHCSSLPFCTSCIDRKPSFCQLLKNPHFQEIQLCSYSQNRHNCCKTCHELDEEKDRKTQPL